MLTQDEIAKLLSHVEELFFERQICASGDVDLRVQVVWTLEGGYRVEVVEWYQQYSEVLIWGRGDEVREAWVNTLLKVKCRLAEQEAHITTDPDLLDEWSKDSRWEVRQSVAKNPHTPVTSLIRLSHDENYEVQCAAWDNPSIPLEE